MVQIPSSHMSPQCIAGYPQSTTDVAFLDLYLTHWGRVMHICVSKQTIIGWRQAIIWTYAGMLLIGPLGSNFSEILIEIYIFSFKKMHLKMSSGNWQPFCLGLNVLTNNKRVRPGCVSHPTESYSRHAGTLWFMVSHNLSIHRPELTGYWLAQH